jgi:hypothetical protein
MYNNKLLDQNFFYVHHLLILHEHFHNNRLKKCKNQKFKPEWSEK